MQDLTAEYVGGDNAVGRVGATLPTTDGGSPLKEIRWARDGVDSQGTGPVSLLRPPSTTTVDFWYLVADTTYTFTVTAINEAGYEGPAATVQLTTPAPVAATGTVVNVEDSSTGTGELQWEFLGSWAVGTNAAGSDHYTNVVGASATIRFIGTSAEVYGAKAANHGHLTVTLDGTVVGTADAYSASRVEDALLFSTGTIADASHTLKLTVASTRNASSTGNYVAINRASIVSTGSDGGGQEPAPAPATRDILKQPFSTTSIWNVPVGSGASTKHAGLAATPHPDQIYKDTWGQSFKVVIDPIYVGMNPSDPLKTASNIYQAGGRSATPNYLIPSGTQVHVPSTMSHNGSWNGICCFLRPSGTTYMDGQSLYLSAGGNPQWCYTTPKTTDADLYGDGRLGQHGGAGMSGLGGLVRRFEWDNYATQPLQHALSMNLFGHRFLSRGSGPEGGPGWRWPATKADSGYSNSSGGNYYALTDPSMPMMGALLCLPATFDLSTVSNARARWLATALKNFGAYVVDNTAWDAHAFSMEKSVQSLFGAESSEFHSQIMSVISALHIVSNNSSTNVGGGGTPRVTPPPPPA